LKGLPLEQWIGPSYDLTRQREAGETKRFSKLSVQNGKHISATQKLHYTELWFQICSQLFALSSSNE